MATRKQKVVVFKDVTPTDERIPFPSVTQTSGDFITSYQSEKPAVRPKLTLNLNPEFPNQRKISPSCFTLRSPPKSHSYIKDSEPLFRDITTSAFSFDSHIVLSPQKIRTNIHSQQHPEEPLTLSTSKRPKLGLQFDKPDTIQNQRRVRPRLTREPNDVDITYLQCITNYQVDNWRHFFERPGKPGEIGITEIRQLLRNPLFIKDMDNHTIEVLQMKCREPERQSVMYQELVDLMSNKRTPSFRIAVDVQSTERLECLSRHDKTTFFQVMVRAVARNFLTDDVERQYYADRYNCCPPPLFIPVITLVEIGLFVYYCVENGTINHNGPVPIESYLIYRPDKRIEFWRFICYTFVHAGWMHLIFNVLVQIVVGIPLEMIHGCLRTGMVYMSGVLAGSLGTSIFDMEAYLVGASGGVYALLAAHLANIVLNYSNMELGILKLAAVLIIASTDVGFAIWGRYSPDETEAPVGYTAHLMGALAGLTIGLVVLKNFEQKLHDQYIWWIALAVYLGCMVFSICWNILYY